MRLGSCLITTPIESNLDIIENEKNGYLIDINIMMSGFKTIIYYTKC